MNPTKTAKQISIPAWAKPAKADKFTIFEAAALLGFEGQWVRLSAADQRALLGGNVFGKQAICVFADGSIEVIRSTCFGNDWEAARYSSDRVADAASRALRLSPGVYGTSFA